MGSDAALDVINYRGYESWDDLAKKEGYEDKNEWYDAEKKEAVNSKNKSRGVK